MNIISVIKYTFLPYFDGYFKDGNFYSSKNKLLKKKYYNGRVCINHNKKRYGINSLRKFAKKNIILEEIPF
jgi:hypothetical protein